MTVRKRRVQVIEGEDGQRFRIMSVRQWAQKPNMPATRREVLEVLAVERWNMRMRKPWWRLYRFVCRQFEIETRYTIKNSLRIPLGKP